MSDPQQNKAGASAAEGRTPYRVEVDHDGCERCSCGRTWTIVGPDDYAIGQSFESQEDAEDLARLLNAAHEYAEAAVLRPSPEPNDICVEHRAQGGDLECPNCFRH